jgi:hypothetical protein
MIRRLLAAIALPLLVAGCYRYAAIDPNAALPMSEVRLNLTAAGASALVPTLGRSPVAVEGRIVQVTDSAYVLSVSSTLVRAPDDETSLTRTVWAGESVTIPKRAVAVIEQRSLDTRRTATAAGLAAVAGILAARIIVHGVGSSGGDSGTGTPVVTP